MFVNDNAANLIPRSVLRCIASKLAPTKSCRTPLSVLCEIPRYKLDALFITQPV
jgi:hypothetical protein